ncbi:hypothetical protein H4217_000135 [Coemansia sp. RSA 1939]|nr:hypothetical protein H4217_000135 [Coemansia sp. RSA 1939]KAJ2617966.1 hypothetical protein EV177_000276 [Coemansia sp. RSA 1804]
MGGTAATIMRIRSHIAPKRWYSSSDSNNVISRAFQEGDMVIVRECSRGGKQAMIGPLDSTQTYHTRRGVLHHRDIIGREPRDRVASKRREERKEKEGETKALEPNSSSSSSSSNSLFFVHHPTLEEFVLLGKRKCTPIYPKDAAAIVSMLDVGPGDNVLEAGTGNGSLTLHLARAVGSAGRVYTVERNPDTSAHAKMLAGRFQRGRLLGSVAFHVGELSEVFSKIDGSNEPSSQNGLVGEPLPVFDAIALDMPAPWTQLPLVAQRLRTDRFCVCYLPNMSQVIDLVRECRPWPLRVEDVLEVQWRSWDVRTTVVRSGNNFSGDPENPDVAMVCRPTHTPAGHTAFLVKLRKCAAPRSDQAAEPEQEPEPEPETPAAN